MPTLSKPAKQFPVDLNCAAVRAISFKGHLTSLTQGGDKLVSDFVSAYQNAAREAVGFLVSMANGALDDRLACYLLINPARVPADIAATTLWKEVVLSEDGGVAGGPWVKIQAGSNVAHLIRGYLNFGRSTGGGTAFAAILAHYGVKPSMLTCENFDRYFGFFGAETVALPFRNAVGGAAKSFLSNRELARELSAERQRTVERLLEESPAFFNPFMRLHKTETAFSAAARHFTELRKQLRDEQVPNAVIAACQWRAVLAHEHLASWHPAEQLNPEFLELADEHPAIVARFAEQVPPGAPKSPLPSDRFKRICSAKAKPRDLARNVHVISRVIGLYQAAFNTLSPEKLAEVEAQHPDGTRSKDHQGWLKIAAATKKSDPVLYEIRSFVLGPVRDFCNAMWPVEVPVTPSEIALSPLIANDDRYGWKESDTPPASAPANAIAVSILIPAYRKADGQSTVDNRVEALIRGNIPGRRAVKLDKPLTVANGTTQYFPDRTIPMPGTSGQRRVYVKMQAMRLGEDRSRLFGVVSASIMPLMPETTRAPAQARAAQRRDAKARNETPTASRFRDLTIGERIATIQVAPGGLRIATIAIFQRVAESKDSPTGFEQIEFSRQVYRSDSDCFDGEGDLRRIKFNQRVKTERIVNFDADWLDRKMEAHAKPLASGFIPMEANRVHMAQFGKFRTNAGKVFYRKVARELADICARNHVGHVVIGGAGIIIGKSRTQHPAREFHTLMKVGGKQQPCGYLTNALGKVGVSIYAVSAKGAKFDMHPVRRGITGPLVPVTAFHVSRTANESEVSFVAVPKGKKARIIRNDWVSTGEDWMQASRCYPTNAAWAILLAWFDADFRANFDEALENVDSAGPIELPALSKGQAVASV